jgi:hypothetical protein
MYAIYSPYAEGILRAGFTAREDAEAWKTQYVREHPEEWRLFVIVY